MSIPVTKGYITKVATPTKNLYKVRIPLLEQAGINASEINSSEYDAILSYTPGAYNGLSVGDTVIVTFENNELNTAIILGKLYLAKDTTMPSAYIAGESLEIIKSARLPADTKIGAVDFSRLAQELAQGINLSDKIGILDKNKQNKLTAGANITIEETEEGTVISAIGGGGGSGDGDVVGPNSAVDSDVALFSGATGKIIKDSGVKLSGLLSRSGGTMDGHLIINGGDDKAIQLNASASGGYGRINDNNTATLLGLDVGNKLLVGHTNYSLSLRGSTTNPSYTNLTGTYNVALTTDVPTIEANPTGTPTVDLNTLKINNVLYNIAGSGGGEIIDDLDSTDTNKALSANMGHLLGQRTDAVVTRVETTENITTIGSLYSLFNQNITAANKLVITSNAAIVTNDTAKECLILSLTKASTKYSCAFVVNNILYSGSNLTASAALSSLSKVAISKLITSDAIVDNLTSTDTTKVLSANQGKALNDHKVSKLSGSQSLVYAHQSDGTESGLPYSATELIDGSLVSRTNTGSIRTVGPVDDYDATTKYYVDTLYNTEKAARETADNKKLSLTGGTLTGTLNSRTIAPSLDNTYSLGTSTKGYSHVYTQNIIKKLGAANLTFSLQNREGTIALLDDIVDLGGAYVTFNSGKISTRIYENYDMPNYFDLTNGKGPCAVFKFSCSKVDLVQAIADGDACVVMQRRGASGWYTPATADIGYGSNRKNKAYIDSPYHNAIKCTDQYGASADGIIKVRDTTEQWSKVVPATASESYQKVLINLPYLAYCLTEHSLNKTLTRINNKELNIYFTNDDNHQFVGKPGRSGGVKDKHLDKVFVRFYIEYNGTRISDFTRPLGIWRNYHKHIVFNVV